MGHRGGAGIASNLEHRVRGKHLLGDWGDRSTQYHDT